jgi:hypothetical protein
MGDSAGHWQGDTLVVDVIGFNDKSWLGSGKNAGEGSGTFHSDALHVTERITRPDFDHLNIQIADDDPKVFTKPWTYTWNMSLVPKERLYVGTDYLSAAFAGTTWEKSFSFEHVTSHVEKLENLPLDIPCRRA